MDVAILWGWSSPQTSQLSSCINHMLIGDFLLVQLPTYLPTQENAIESVSTTMRCRLSLWSKSTTFWDESVSGRAMRYQNLLNSFEIASSSRFLHAAVISNIATLTVIRKELGPPSTERATKHPLRQKSTSSGLWNAPHNKRSPQRSTSLHETIVDSILQTVGALIWYVLQNDRQ